MSYEFVPKRVLFEKKALEYQLGADLWLKFRAQGIPVKEIPSHNRVTEIPGKDAAEAYTEAKSTLVVGVRKTLSFQSCRPSADYQLPLATSCPGKCQYCYLQTTLGKKPYLRIYVNQAEILEQALTYIRERQPQKTTFEGAATSDPLPVEPYSGALAKAILFFGQQENGFFRFVTKFTNVDSLLDINHNGHTRFRFSINSSYVIDRYEKGTPKLNNRLTAAAKTSAANYPLGFIIAPVIIYDGWQDDYYDLMKQIKQTLNNNNGQDLTFEVIAHRFTRRAKKNILDVFPHTTLPMEEKNRRKKFGQFGYMKFVYSKETYKQIEAFFSSNIEQLFPSAKLAYIT